MQNKNIDKNSIEMAYFKFSLIAPVIQDTYTESTKTAYYKRVTETPFTLPDGRVKLYKYKTLEKWEEYFLKSGMDGLMPKVRSDAGKSRVLNESAIKEIYRLKDEFPRINATLIYEKLIRNGFINKNAVSLSCIQRFIKYNNLKAAINSNQKDRKAFEEEKPGGRYQADTSYTCYINESGKSQANLSNTNS